MAAVPSLSEPQRSGGLHPAAPKPAATSTKGLQSSGDLHPAVSHLVQKLVEEVLAWQRRNGFQKIPSKYSGDCEERKLALRFEKLLLRRDKALGTEPSRSQLSPSEVALVNSVPGVPLHGCSATASCSSKSRTMTSTNPAAKKARLATAVASSGGPHAAPSNSVDEVESSSSGVAQSAAAKQPTSHAGRVLQTGSSDVAQLAATCQEPRSPVLFMKILEPIWAIEVADGQKMFECVANKTKWQNQFKQGASGDLIIVFK